MLPLASDPAIGNVVWDRVNTFTDLHRDGSLQERTQMYRVLLADALDTLMALVSKTEVTCMGSPATVGFESRFFVGMARQRCLPWHTVSVLWVGLSDPRPVCNISQSNFGGVVCAGYCGQHFCGRHWRSLLDVCRITYGRSEGSGQTSCACRREYDADYRASMSQNAPDS